MPNPLLSSKLYIALAVWPEKRRFLPVTFGTPSQIGGRIRQLDKLADLVEDDPRLLEVVPAFDKTALYSFTHSPEVWLIPREEVPAGYSELELGVPGQLRMTDDYKFKLWSEQ